MLFLGIRSFTWSRTTLSAASSGDSYQARCLAGRRYLPLAKYSGANFSPTKNLSTHTSGLAIFPTRILPPLLTKTKEDRHVPPGGTFCSLNSAFRRGVIVLSAAVACIKRAARLIGSPSGIARLGKQVHLCGSQSEEHEEVRRLL